jgi:hypothetical protein
MEKQEIANLMTEMGLTVESVFVPFSKSRHANPEKGQKPWRSLNWKVTLKNGRDILTTNYSAGEAHCPSYKHNARRTADYEAAINFEVENGKRATPLWFGSSKFKPSGETIKPDPVDVLYSLVSDSSVLDYSTYEDWAGDLGYDPDSRKGEAVYRECLEIALKLRNGLSETNLAKLRDAFQDY